MTDSKSSASVVIVDPAKAAAERDRLARAELSDSAAGGSPMLVVKDIALTVPYTLKLVHPPGAAPQKVADDAAAALREAFDITNKHLNHHNPDSEVSQINALPAHMTHDMSPVLSKVMHCAVSVHANAGKGFDVACGPLVHFLKVFLSNPANAGKDPHKEPQFADLLEISSLSGGFKLCENQITIQKRDERARLDFGSIAKGFAVDYVIDTLVKRGYDNCFFDWGGDCRGSGRNAVGELWAVGIVRPPQLSALKARDAKDNAARSNQDENAPLLRVMHLDNEAVATSGDYENLFEAAGDPKHPLYTTNWNPRLRRMQRPTNKDICQATIKCFTAMYADALATAVLNMSSFALVRMVMDNWRWKRNAVTDFTLYIRDGERMAKMCEISRESADLRAKRIGNSLPARVVVAGGGLAGLCASIEAARCGAQVILLEKSGRLGGNSAKATSGINAWGTRPQAQQGVIDGDKYFERDTYLSGIGGSCDGGLVRMLSVKSSDAIKFLSDFGIPLTVLSQLGGHSRKRCHRAPDKSDGTPVPIGYTIMKTLEDYIRKHLAKHITIMVNSPVKTLIRQVIPQVDGSERIKVLGVVFKPEGSVEDVTLYADAVVLATGGFSNDSTPNSLLREFAPHLYGRPTTNGAFATGDGVKMARETGAQLIDMDKVQLHPTGFIDPKDPSNSTKFLGPEALRGSGGVLLNKNGERFVNELDLRSVVSKAINEQKNVYPNSNGCNVAYCVLNEAAAKLFGPSALQFYWKKQGLFSFAEDVNGLAKLMDCSVDNLVSTLSTYESLSSSKTPCPQTGKRVFPCVVGPKGPFYVATITPSIHYTMGGCLISPSAEVQSLYINTSVFGSRRPIQGLFGAGEVTGGVHGKNRLGGNSLLECVVFGRIAGDRAATILQKNPHALSATEWSAVILRETREGDEFGHGSRVLRFNLPGATQSSGLKIGQFVSIRGEWDGQTLVGYYSPITLPDDHGVIGILVRVDKGTLKDWLKALRPGDAVEMRACGGLVIERVPSLKQLQFEKEPIRRIAMIAGGSGVAPMIQIIRAALKRPYVTSIQSLDLIYAAEDVGELTYRRIFDQYEKADPEHLKIHYVLNNPPPKWTGGVGFVDRTVLAQCVPAPCRELLIVICGPPMMQRVTKTTLIAMGHNPKRVRTVDEEPVQPSKL